MQDDPTHHLFGAAESKLGPEVEEYLEQDRKVGGGGVTLYARSCAKVKILEKSSITGTENGENYSYSLL